MLSLFSLLSIHLSKYNLLRSYVEAGNTSPILYASELYEGDKMLHSSKTYLNFPTRRVLVTEIVDLDMFVCRILALSDEVVGRQHLFPGTAPRFLLSASFFRHRPLPLLKK